ncbi:hypothetical protein KFK09_008548 [Dendrobium nobile]|uniref:Uncharacterized protein n=1 Tax=Dendrobium nobile TaxID=94219 RepID=A0A8T3BQ91_DENNO|nr:hypothetical protein KFK09_013048 [Dendrobium nobile]KAI0515880.1 hypothetical protein KFK09_008548 [Dendrobium nobile]
MADPELEWGLVFDAQGNLDVLRSPFFDAGFESDEDTVGDYLDRILPSLIKVIDRQRPDYEWTIDGRPPVPPPHPTPSSLSLRISGAVYLGVVSSLVWFFFSRQP